MTKVLSSKNSRYVSYGNLCGRLDGSRGNGCGRDVGVRAVYGGTGYQHVQGIGCRQLVRFVRECAGNCSYYSSVPRLHYINTSYTYTPPSLRQSAPCPKYTMKKKLKQQL